MAAQQRGFARPGSSDERDDLAGPHDEACGLEGFHAAGIDDPQVAHFEHRFDPPGAAAGPRRH